MSNAMSTVSKDPPGRRALRLIGLAALFVSAVLGLLLLLWQLLHQTETIARPVGQSVQPIPGLGTPPAQDLRDVLVLNSYHNGYTWSDNEMAGVAETLLNADHRIQPLVEYLDCKHFPKMDHFDQLRDLFQQKYHGKDFPLVIVADNPALAFALKYRPQLFPRATIVFCGINGYLPALIEGFDRVTGVAEILDARTTLALALQLHPATRTVVVVHDYTMTGLATRRETEEQLRQFAGRVRIEYLPNLSTRALMDALRLLPADSLVLALSYSLDKDGQVINHENISRLLSDSAPVPVYGLHEERLGYGIVGGSLLGGKLQGQRAAELALDVLAGRPLPAVRGQSPARMMFDYNQMTRFSIPARALPPGTIVVNQPVSFVASHPALVVTTVAIIALLACGIVILGFNIYQRKLAERQQQALQAQLIQSQKMEAVGHLAGGVAHDFNNILTAIIGYGSILQAKVGADPELTSCVEQVLVAADRAAGLTRSLLAFSRKQVLEPKATDLNEIVRGIAGIATRLIGEDIVLRTVLAAQPLTVMADGGQIEQVLLNLCTNARDALPQGGSLTIETELAEVDEAARGRSGLERAGRYALLCVSDSGVGMDEQTRRQIFEPFFTTKEVGKGTGLGLSIVYGIVKQHGGAITVYSEPGQGSTFKMFLPLVLPAAPAVPAAPDPVPTGGKETILLAEDEREVRALISIILRNAGYTVIEAIDGDAAVRAFCENAGRIALLLFDVIMPKKNGKDAYARILALRPGVKVLFMSGYTADIIQSKGMLPEALPLLSKPIIPDALLRRVREVLDSRG